MSLLSLLGRWDLIFIRYESRMMLLHDKFKNSAERSACLMCLPYLIFADWRGVRSQRGCWPGERVSTLLCFLTDAQKGVNNVRGEKTLLPREKCVCVSYRRHHRQPSFFRFSTELSSGLLEVISPPAAYYPDLTNLKETFGDSRERVRYAIHTGMTSVLSVCSVLRHLIRKKR